MSITNGPNKGFSYALKKPYTKPTITQLDNIAGRLAFSGSEDLLRDLPRLVSENYDRILDLIEYGGMVVFDDLG